MSSLEFGLYSKNVHTDNGTIEAVVVIKEGKISAIISPELAHPNCPVEDLSHLHIGPGLIDSHVHINEPGRTDWEGFITATRAAAAGGITTIADMPLNCDPVTTSLKALEIKLPETENKLWVNCAFYGGIVPGNENEIEPMIMAGVVGFKCFLVHSGIDEFPNVREADLRKALPILAKHKIPLLVHAELDCSENNSENNQASTEATHKCTENHLDHWQDKSSYMSFLKSRPRHWENDAIEMMISLCREFKSPVHIVHLSSSDAIKSISIAKKDGLPITVETCPHYLTFEAETIPDGDPLFKCAPPIRESENKNKLWKGLTAGIIDMIVSDHSPCTPDKKFIPEKDLQKAWGGISSLQFGLSSVLTEAEKRNIELNNIFKWMSQKPAEFLGLGNRKGKIEIGYDADLIVFDPKVDFIVKPELIYHKNKISPYIDKNLKGLIHRTYLQGRLIYEDGKFTVHTFGEKLLQNKSRITIQ